MVKLKTPAEIEIMAEAGAMVGRVLAMIDDMVAPGVTTGELDRAAEAYIRQMGGEPTFKGYRVGNKVYPASICASIDEEVVHGIPGSRVMKEGQVLSVDIGVTFQGYVGDSAWTFPVGEVDDDTRRLLDVGRESLKRALDAVRPGGRLSDIGRAVQGHVESAGFNVVKKYVGHGIGRSMHEDPQIPNFVNRGTRRNDRELVSGMVMAIEPMVNAGAEDVRELDDGWTVVTADGRTSVHFEHTVAVVDDGRRVLTTGPATSL